MSAYPTFSALKTILKDGFPESHLSNPIHPSIDWILKAMFGEDGDYRPFQRSILEQIVSHYTSSSSTDGEEGEGEGEPNLESDEGEVWKFKAQVGGGKTITGICIAMFMALVKNMNVVIIVPSGACSEWEEVLYTTRLVCMEKIKSGKIRFAKQGVKESKILICHTNSTYKPHRQAAEKMLSNSKRNVEGGQVVLITADLYKRYVVSKGWVGWADAFVIDEAAKYRPTLEKIPSAFPSRTPDGKPTAMFLLSASNFNPLSPVLQRLNFATLYDEDTLEISDPYPTLQHQKEALSFEDYVKMRVDLYNEITSITDTATRKARLKELYDGNHPLSKGVFISGQDKNYVIALVRKIKSMTSLTPSTLLTKTGKKSSKKGKKDVTSIIKFGIYSPTNPKSINDWKKGGKEPFSILCGSAGALGTGANLNITADILIDSFDKLSTTDAHQTMGRVYRAGAKYPEIKVWYTCGEKGPDSAVGKCMMFINQSSFEAASKGVYITTKPISSVAAIAADMEKRVKEIYPDKSITRGMFTDKEWMISLGYAPDVHTGEGLTGSLVDEVLAVLDGDDEELKKQKLAVLKRVLAYAIMQ